MNVRRGDVVLVHYPFTSGVGGSLRPALVVQNNRVVPTGMRESRFLIAYSHPD
jgi:mRNA-degrading endonuclease toxin of MazEF toxin-antitoxin module